MTDQWTAKFDKPLDKALKQYPPCSECGAPSIAAKPENKPFGIICSFELAIGSHGSYEVLVE